MMTVVQTLEELGYTEFSQQIQESEDGRAYLTLFYHKKAMAQLFIAPDVLRYMMDMLLSVSGILTDPTVEVREIGEFEYAIISIPQSTM